MDPQDGHLRRRTRQWKTSVPPTTACCGRGFTMPFGQMWLQLLMAMVLVIPSVNGQAGGPLAGPITRPPQIGDKPIVANGIVYYLRTVPPHCIEPYVATYPSGGVVHGKRALMKMDNPHVIYGNIEIPPDACLYIEPGSLMRFGPGFGIIVNGTLIARGSEEDGGRIIMTKDRGADTGQPSGDWHDDARLSGGNTTRDGRLDLLYQGKWRAICTNYQNFSSIDVNVTCRHLGFLKGNFTYHSFSRNLTDYMLWEKPDCLGTENSLFKCPGTSKIQIGTHICDGQQVVGFECEGMRPGLALDHWRGIEFLNSTSHTVAKDDNVLIDESFSWLEYLDILYPGLDTFHGRTNEPDIFYPKAAISASPLVPLMNNVTIMYGAYDAFNFTEITGNIHIANCTIHKNRGYGLFIHTAVGQTLINTTEVTENWGDGIKFYISNLTIHDFRRNFTWGAGFCNRANQFSQIFPVFEYQDVVGPSGETKPGSKYCERSFRTTKDKSVNLHFLLMERDPEATGKLTIREGQYSFGELIREFEISNGSFPQSVRTKGGAMFVRFDYTLPNLASGQQCKTFPPCIRFLLRVTTSNGTEDEFQLVYSKVSDNNGYGVNIQDIRSKVFINTTEVTGNEFGAGIRVYQGAGEVIINNTLVENNKDAGINITYSGGYQLLNNTRLIRNRGYGVITEYLRLNRTRIEFMHKMEVVRGIFMFNELIGLRVGNYCLGGSVLVNESRFAYSFDEAIEYLSCNISSPRPTNFSVAFTDFESNIRHAILMKPLLNTVGIITNCTFTNHSLAALRIDNGYDLLISKWYRNFPVYYDIFENKFHDNFGRYAVNLRLTDGTPLQKLYFKFNRLWNNYIQDSFMYINPRGQANAVAVVSSGNIYFKRNILANPESVREVATHLLDPSVTIDSTENYWDIEIVRQSDFEKIHLNIFDQDDRYNLAKISYYPALKTNQVYENVLTTDVPRYVWSFSRAGNVIGGLLESGGFTAQTGKTYYVDRDIYVFPGQAITLAPRVTLAFASTVGMVVHGCLKADGQNAAGTIHFKLWTDPDILPLENRTATVRLANGLDLYEGRLEVLIDDEWGTVCNEGWTQENAALACQQLGLIYNPDQGSASLKVVAPPETSVLMSWVTCDEVDDDLTGCRAVRYPDVNCGHDRDVYLRCQYPTWAGVTLPATTRLGQSCAETQLRALHLERAGLLDAATMTFTPALRIDYNFYTITAVTITDSLSDGVHVNYNHPYEIARLEYIQVHNNQGHGVVTRYPRLELLHSNVTGSGKAGFQYDPFFSEFDALSVRSMVHESRRRLMNETTDIQLGTGQMTFLMCPPGQAQESRDYHTEVRTDYNTYRIVVQVLDYFPVTEIEQVTIFDAPRQNIGSSTKKWSIPEDLVDFPIVSTTNVLTIRLSVRGLRSGRLAFAILSQIASSGAPVLTTYVHNTTFSHNYQGIQTKHYNSPTNRRLEIFHRFKLETIKFDRVNVLYSKKEAIHMPSVTKFTDDYIPTYEDMTVPERVATIRYNISLAKLADNENGILAEHNHVDFANNVWQWTITDSVMVRTRNGGLEIEVPRVNDEVERKKHSVSILETLFQDNNNFACTIAGYNADVRVENNLFGSNRCLVGLFTMTGMEKNLSFVNNRITSNIGRHMVDINIVSHSEYSESVIGIMRLNDIQNNRYEGLDPPGFGNSPKTYAVSFRGVQDMQANRNLFNNPQLGYELVAGIMALSLGNPVNVKENFWGRTDYAGILTRIFDFDDWNNYAIADFFPYLTRADVNGDLSQGQPVKPPLNTNQLGGRVLENQILAYKTTPYIVESDLTVMPDVTLTISPGVELQFRPNVGILVLGRLVAEGMEYNRIKMRPVQATNVNPIGGRRKKRAATATIRLRGDGTLFKDAGFLELYNSSTRSWNMMCDSQFNEKSAEVVCRQLGKETINVRVRFTHLYDFYVYGEPQYFLKEFWFESYYCRGDETSLTQCITRYNYNMQQCIRAANYSFIVCGERNLEAGQDYWGNIRFAAKSYQEQPLEDDIGRQESILKYVDIEGAGILHGEKVGAVQTTYVTPQMNHLNITKSAENGFDIIAPRAILEMRHVNVTNNLGYGYNFLILNGESSNRDSSFTLLGESTIPYNVYGLVEICRMEKEILLDTRMILYYKYGPNSRDCVKIIRSSTVRGRVGLRFLQINMFHEDFSRNVIEIFDGSQISPSTLVTEIFANTSSTETGQLYQSTGDKLTVHVHASVSHGSYGFIAEVVMVPLTGLTYPGSNYQHSLSQSIARGNQDGALQYKNVGEVNPSLYVDQCWFENNGVAVLNLTSPPVIDMSLQGTLLFRFASNFVSHNKGGMYLSLHTNSIATAIKGNITNNIFSFGTNGEALNITGHYFQRVYIFQNYIFNYSAGDYRDVVHIRDVVVNYTYNYLDNNTGHYILTAYNSDNRQARQEYTRSGFLRNNATALLESTIKIGRGRPFFEHNYIVNDENDFEMETYPMLDPSDEAIDAKNNWWGSDLRSYISGKLWDNFDNPKLVSVDFWQPKLDNRSVVEGKCPPGWKLDSGRCYRFMGGALPYHEANKFCQSLGAFLAEGKGREGFYNYLLRLMRNLNDPLQRVWVMSEVGSGRCSAIENTYIIYEEDCWNILYPFICEKDPYLAPPVDLEATVVAMAAGIAAGIGGALILIIIILSILWCVKSKRREKERFERTASLRSSVRSSMRGSKSTLTILSAGPSRRRLNEIDDFSQASSGGKMSQGTEDLNASMASLHSGYRNGRAVAVDRTLADQRGTERSGWHERGERWRERGVDREADRGERDQVRETGRRREMERGRDRERGRRYQQDDDDEESYAGSRGKEASESEEEEKKDFDETEDEEDSFDSDPEEDQASRSAEHLFQNNQPHLYQNNQPRPLPGMANGAVQRVRSRDDVYENQHVESRPQKSRSLLSFSQPESADESPVKSIFPPRHQDLPTPPPTPPQSQNSWQPQLAPKPQLMSHPAVNQLCHSPVPSAASQRSADKPSPQPRRQVGGSQGSSLSSTPQRSVPGSHLDYDMQVASLPAKLPLRSNDSSLRSTPPASKSGDEYQPRTPPLDPTHRLPHLPRYSPPLPMDGPPSYDESDQYPGPAAARYIPSYPQEPPQQDVDYLPRQQQMDRRQFHGSRDRLGGSQDRLDGRRNQFGGSRDRLAGNRERLNSPYSPAAYSPGVLHLNSESPTGHGNGRQEHLETEI